MVRRWPSTRSCLRVIRRRPALLYPPLRTLAGASCSVARESGSWRSWCVAMDPDGLWLGKSGVPRLAYVPSSVEAAARTGHTSIASQRIGQLV